MCLLTSSCAGVSAMCKTSEEIERREEEDPHQLDEVPVEAGILDAVREPFPVGAPQLAACGQKIRVDDDAADDVQAVQAGEHEIDGVEIVVRGNVAVVELVGVLEVLDYEEHQREAHCGRH